jgi:aspartyl-tRNA(Asn)/glutamyl-tRNA(Gln) amidotransferase subunit B
MSTEIKAKIIANIVINDLMKHANEKDCKVNELGLSSYDVWWFSELIFHEVLDRSKVTKVIDHFIKFGGEVKEIIGQLGLWPTLDTGALEEAVDKVISDNPKIVKQILAGKEKALGSLIGRLKQVDRNIDSKEAMTLLKEKING